MQQFCVFCLPACLGTGCATWSRCSRLGAMETLIDKTNRPWNTYVSLSLAWMFLSLCQPHLGLNWFEISPELFAYHSQSQRQLQTWPKASPYPGYAAVQHPWLLPVRLITTENWGEKILLLEFQLSALWTAKISWYTHTLLTFTWHMTPSRHSWQLQWLCWGLCLFPHWALLALVLQHGLVHLWLPRIYVLPGSSWFAWQHSV